MEGVFETTLGLPSERLETSEKFFGSLDDNAHMLVAEVDRDGTARVVGSIGLVVDARARKRHVGYLGIMVHRDYQRCGVGRKLMAAILDLADNWLMLKRVYLDVFVDNFHAVKLYESFGFEIEGKLRAASVKNGCYADEYVMGRVRP